MFIPVDSQENKTFVSLLILMVKEVYHILMKMEVAF